VKRKRGNPPDVLKALTFLRGGRFCEVCGVTEYQKRIELHHKDGNWRNYQVNNLGFYCSDCHLDDHNGCWSNLPNQKGENMPDVVKKFSWDGQPTVTLFAKVQEYVNQGYCIEEACREISKDSEVIFGRYFKADSLSSTYHRRRRINSEQDSTVVNNTPVRTTGLTASMSEMIKVVRLMERYGITITN
jgi:hypothetical protein